MQTYDTLQIVGGEEKSFTAWGFQLASVRGLKRNQAADTFKATMVNTTVAAEADSPTFPFESRVIVRVNRAATTSAGPFTGGTVKFIGRRVECPQKQSASGQIVTYTFHGGFYEFENTDFQQQFANNENQALIGETILNTGLDQNDNLLNISLGDQIQALAQFILDDAVVRGVPTPFQYTGRDLTGGKIDLTTTNTVPSVVDNASKTFANIVAGEYPYYYQNQVPASPTIDRTLFLNYNPTQIEKPKKCADLLKLVLGKWPRANVWFDYTTVDGSGNPLPTLHVDVVDNITPITLPLVTGGNPSDGQAHKSLQINRRDDLLVRAVNIIYRITVGGNAGGVGYAVDQWGPHGSNSYYPVYSAAATAWLTAHPGDVIGANKAGAAAATAAVTVTAGTVDPISGLRVFTELVDLSGGSISTVKGHLDVEPIGVTDGGTIAQKRAWWSGGRGGDMKKFIDSCVRFSSIGDSRIYYTANGVDSTGATVYANQEFTDADYNFFTNKMVRGEHCAWMQIKDGQPGNGLLSGAGVQPVFTTKARITATVSYKKYKVVATGDTTGQLPSNESASDAATNGGTKDEVMDTEDVHVNVELTNGVTGSYSTISQETPGELYIIGSGGIAQYLYEQMTVIQHDGEVGYVAANFLDSTAANYINHGRALNLSGGATAWLTMNAQIQEISEDYGSHTTSMRIGVAKHLNAGDLSSLLNQWAFRRPWYNPKLRDDNSLTAGGTIDQAITAGSANTTPGLTVKSMIGLSTLATPTDPSSPILAGLQLDTSQMTLADTL